MEIIQYTGQTITKPGIYANIPMSDYHGKADLCDGPSISNTGLRLIETCPEKYWDSSPLNPNGEPIPETEAMKFGRLAHALCLENRMPADMIVSPYEAHRTKEAKEWVAAQEAAGLTVYKEKDIETAKAMAERLALEPMVANQLFTGLIEHSLIWKDPFTGVWIKTRPDTISTDTVLSDYKTTDDASEENCSRSITKYKYNRQMALGAEGCARAIGLIVDSFALVFQEKKRPYTVTVASLHDEDISLGARCNRLAIDRFARCLESNDWPGYAEGPVTVRLQPYELKRLRENDALLPEVQPLEKMVEHV